MNIPTLTSEQMAEVDRLMIDEYGILLIQMMENAGRNLAEQASRMLDNDPTGRKIVVLCGTGNNGGGGMVAARHLHNRGARVSVKLVGDPAGLKAIPAHQWDILQVMALTQADDPDLTQADLIIDAIIGYGLTGIPRGAAADWIRRANDATVQSGNPILALDAPSGLDTTTGSAGDPGPNFVGAVRARATLTLALPKTGLMVPGARQFVGQLYLADIGVPPELYGRLQLEVGPIFTANAILKVD
jgi:NAD(P)H-hydrate epimerase